MKKRYILPVILICLTFLGCENNAVENNCLLNDTFKFSEITGVGISWGIVLDSAGNAPEINLPDIDTASMVFEGMIMDFKTDPTECEAYQLTIQGSETVEKYIFRFSTGTRTTTCKHVLENNTVSIDHCEQTKGFIITDLNEDSMEIIFTVVVRTDDTIDPCCEDVLPLSGFDLTLKLE